MSQREIKAMIERDCSDDDLPTVYTITKRTYSMRNAHSAENSEGKGYFDGPLRLYDNYRSLRNALKEESDRPPWKIAQAEKEKDKPAKAFIDVKSVPDKDVESVTFVSSPKSRKRKSVQADQTPFGPKDKIFCKEQDASAPVKVPEKVASPIECSIPSAGDKSVDATFGSLSSVQNMQPLQDWR